MQHFPATRAPAAFRPVRRAAVRAPRRAAVGPEQGPGSSPTGLCRRLWPPPRTRPPPPGLRAALRRARTRPGLSGRPATQQRHPPSPVDVNCRSRSPLFPRLPPAGLTPHIRRRAPLPPQRLRREWRCCASPWSRLRRRGQPQPAGRCCTKPPRRTSPAWCPRSPSSSRPPTPSCRVRRREGAAARALPSTTPSRPALTPSAHARAPLRRRVPGPDAAQPAADRAVVEPAQPGGVVRAECVGGAGGRGLHGAGRAAAPLSPARAGCLVCRGEPVPRLTRPLAPLSPCARAPTPQPPPTPPRPVCNGYPGCTFFVTCVFFVAAHVLSSPHAAMGLEGAALVSDRRPSITPLLHPYRPPPPRPATTWRATL